MRCPDAHALLALHAVDGLDAEAAREIEAHLAECDACRERQAPLAATRRALRTAELPLPPPTDAWLIAGRAARQRARHRRIVRLTSVAAAAALILGLASVLGLRVEWQSNAVVVGFGRRAPGQAVTLDQVVTALDRLALSVERQRVQHERDLMSLAQAFDELRNDDLLRARDLVGTSPTWQAPTSAAFDAVLVAYPVGSDELAGLPDGDRVRKKLKP